MVLGETAVKILQIPVPRRRALRSMNDAADRHLVFYFSDKICVVE